MIVEVPGLFVCVRLWIINDLVESFGVAALLNGHVIRSEHLCDCKREKSGAIVLDVNVSVEALDNITAELHTLDPDGLTLPTHAHITASLEFIGSIDLDQAFKEAAKRKVTNPLQLSLSRR